VTPGLVDTFLSLSLAQTRQLFGHDLRLYTQPWLLPNLGAVRIAFLYTGPGLPRPMTIHFKHHGPAEYGAHSDHTGQQSD